MSRKLEIGGRTLTISEATQLENDAGAVVWDSALVLAHYFEHQATKKRNNFLKGKRVLELGSGTGAAGLAAAALGATVTLTDLPHLTPHIQGNITANELSGSATAAPLDWRDTPTTWASAGIEPGSYDYVIGSDLVYDMTIVPHLLRTVRQLSGPQTKTLLAYERRAGTDAFDDSLRANFGPEAVELISMFDLHPHWSDPAIWVYELMAGAPS